MKKNLWILMSVVLTMLVFTACEKDDSSSDTKAVFSYITDGFKVNFTNFSTNATDYSWDFGDQSEPSILSNPVHVFPQKGQYLVTLTAKMGTATSTFTDTVLIIGPNIKIDGDFTDWAYVDYTHENAPGTGGSLTGIKTFASAGYLNFYVEGTSDFSFTVLDFYLDADNNPATGYSAWMYPAGSGADYLFEGSVPGEWGDVYQHVGPGNDWNWNAIASFSDVLQFSAFKTVSGKQAVEFAIKRSALSAMQGYVNFAILESNSGWAEIGAMPADQTPESKFIAFKL
ncbi:MAG TPA: PKD domain-containing protein [Bacteroidales bacterium]|nr:PKD domain-containing protein [Bacteroidales bacterium]